MRADNSRHLITAAQQRAEQTRRRAVAALRRMDATGMPISFESLSREAGVSRSWLYAQADLRHEVERLRARHQPQPFRSVSPDRQRASETSSYAASRPPPNGSAASSATTTSYATRSPRPSANAAPRRSSAPQVVATRPTRRARN